LVLGYYDTPAGIWKPACYSGNGGKQPVTYRLGKPTRSFAAQPDFLNLTANGRAKIHFCPPLQAMFGILGRKDVPIFNKVITHKDQDLKKSNQQK